APFGSFGITLWQLPCPGSASRRTSRLCGLVIDARFGPASAHGGGNGRRSEYSPWWQQDQGGELVAPREFERVRDEREGDGGGREQQAGSCRGRVVPPAADDHAAAAGQARQRGQ